MRAEDDNNEPRGLMSWGDVATVAAIVFLVVVIGWALAQVVTL